MNRLGAGYAAYLVAVDDCESEFVNDAPFFIVGSGRSGTTLLRAILATHSRLTIPPETWYLNRLTDLLAVERALTAEEVDRVTRTMIGHYRWPDLEVQADEFRREVAGLKNPHLRDIVELVYRKHLRRDGKVRWGDKTPGYIELVPKLAQLFAGAQFIHFIRDGRDVAKSFQAKSWYGDRLHDNAREWIDAMDCSERWSNSEVSKQILQVRYEDLVLDTEGTVRRICSFLGEQFEPGMLAWPGTVDQLVPGREAHIHEKLKRKPGMADIYRWKREMTLREILVCEAFMGRHLKAHGYELRFGGAAWKPVLRFTRWYCEWALPIVGLPLKAFELFKRRLFGRATASAQSNSHVEF